MTYAARFARMLAPLVLITLLAVSVQAKEGTPCNPGVSQETIAALFDRWNASLATGKAEEVAKNYAVDGVLLPTVSNKVRRTPAEIQDYFVHFLELKPQGVINERSIRIYGDVAIDSGIYTFTISKDGKEDKVGARYTFVYRNKGDDWRIIEHHSSKLPELVK